MKILLLWMINAISLLAVAYLMPSIVVDSFWAALGAALLLGLVNAVIRPVLILLTLPATLLTLGLFIFVINGLLFWFAGSFFQGFTVRTDSGRDSGVRWSIALSPGCFWGWRCRKRNEFRNWARAVERSSDSVR